MANIETLPPFEVDALMAPVAAGYLPGCSTVFGRILQHGGQDRNGWEDLGMLE